MLTDVIYSILGSNRYCVGIHDNWTFSKHPSTLYRTDFLFILICRCGALSYNSCLVNWTSRPKRDRPWYIPICRLISSSLRSNCVFTKLVCLSVKYNLSSNLSNNFFTAYWRFGPEICYAIGALFFVFPFILSRSLSNRLNPTKIHP